MKKTGLLLLVCLVIMFCGCDKASENGAGQNGSDIVKPVKLDYADADFGKPEDVIDVYYRALFINDTDTAYNLIWERDRWFVFDDEFRARFKINAFIYPNLVADKFSYQFVSVKQNEDSAEISVQITAPDLTLANDLLSNRLFDATLPPITINELKTTFAGYNWQFNNVIVNHRLLFEEGRWYIYYDFETIETIAEFLRQADRLIDSRSVEALTDAREKYSAALALNPDLDRAREGLEAAETRLALVYDAQQYIALNMELADFTAKDFSSADNPWPIPGVTFKIRNNGDRDLSKIWVEVTFYGGSGREVSSEMFDPLNDLRPKGYGQVLKAGETWEFPSSEYYGSVSTSTVWQQNWEPGQARVTIVDVEFTDEQ